MMTSTPTDPIRLTYFDIRGLAEPARLILRYAGVPFEDVRINKEQWPEIKPTTKTGKVPFLEIDGTVIVESYAIDRLLARRYGLAGDNDVEQAIVDGAADVLKDFYNANAPWFYCRSGFRPGDIAQLRKDVFEPVIANYLPIFEKYLAESGSGFLVKSGLTWADFVVSEYVISLRVFEPDVLKGHPNLEEYVQRILEIPQLKSYYDTRVVEVITRPSISADLAYGIFGFDE